MKVTFLGHAGFQVKTGGKTLIFDPFISPNPAAAHIEVDALAADYMLLSHAHGDHIADVESIVKRTNAKIIASYEVGLYFEAKGLMNYHPMNAGGKWSFDFGTVKCVKAVHSSVFPDGSAGGNPLGFVVKSADATFYYSGDTALTYDMKLIPNEYGYKLTHAFLCMGDNFTMGVEDALIAASFIDCDTIIGMHFDTFGYIKIDHEAAIKKFADKGKRLILMNIGETIDI